MTPVYQRRVREENLKKVLRLIHRVGSTSRPAIAREFRLSPATVTSLVAELKRRGLVRENGFGESTGGRKPAILEFNTEWAWVVAAKIGVKRVRVGLANLKGELKSKTVEPLVSSHFQDVIAQILRMVQALLVATPHPRILGMGVCCPGVIDRETGEVVKAVNLGWYNVPLQKLLSEHFEWPVFVEDGADAGALGEKWFGNGKDVKNLIYVVVGNGIGSGVIVNGELYTGHQHAAGEFGHTSIDFSGPPCPCGNRGCLELYASALAIVRKAQEAIAKGEPTIIRDLAEEEGELSGELISEAAFLGDAVALRIFQETGELLGKAIGNLVNIFDPEMVILGGGLSLAHPIFFETIATTVKHYSLFLHREPVEVRRAFFGGDSELVGAAALTVERVFGERVPGA
ncbi:ROK family protein [Candidatus Caldatribacterium sp.]|uniref:ROK family transcriptional regulator n=1 Tax=Candidatus Caldatribacterium sp. TaxID=2282143 RepID=UPI0029913DE6|nr:ROK family transcriptional regulator [Candidatus Caldatribacterium sp.]MDW8080963.1 ROK family transcriptional regulator [Candidatus Calescibacterium sp.]